MIGGSSVNDVMSIIHSNAHMHHTPDLIHTVFSRTWTNVLECLVTSILRTFNTSSFVWFACFSYCSAGVRPLTQLSVQRSGELLPLLQLTSTSRATCVSVYTSTSRATCVCVYTSTSRATCVSIYTSTSRATCVSIYTGSSFSAILQVCMWGVHYLEIGHLWT